MRPGRSLLALALGFGPIACGGDAFRAAELRVDAGDDQGALDEGGRDSAGDEVLEDAGHVDARLDAISTPDSPTSADGAADAAPVCLTDLSGVGAGDFHIAFRLKTTASGGTYALLSQRTGCDMATVWWDVTLQPLGGVELATDDGSAASYVFVEEGNSVNDGQTHRMVVARTNGAIWLSADGVVRSSMTPDLSSFGTFGAALSIGSSSCGSEAPLAGAVSDVCITIP